MKQTDRLLFRCQDPVAADIDEIADRTGLSVYEVVQRLINLGLQDIDEIDDGVLFGAVSGPRTTDRAD